MSYTEAELEIIKRRRPDLKITPPVKISLDTIIVEFLKKYEVYVKPVTTQTRNVGQDAVAGAITGAFGADVGGDAFQISGQAKQTKVQEWTQWKQWASDHKDFEAFKNEMNAKLEDENKKINEYLESDQFKKEANEILAKKKKDDDLDVLLVKILLGVIFVGSIAVLIITNLNKGEENNYSSSSKETIERKILVAEKK